MKRLIILLAFLSGWAFSAEAIDHPSLLFTRRGAAVVRAAAGTNAAFDASVAEVVAAADRALNEPIVVPVPKDGGGGYTHEKHKDNYYVMYYSGIAYQLTGNEAYARKVADMLHAYAELYPTLGYHPVTLSAIRGRLFWQTLNECVWLVHTAIAYDCVYDYIPETERNRLETDLFRPYADFLMNGTADNRANRKMFNLVHNHGTWSAAAVGMIGFVMGDDDMVDMALYGSDKSGRNGGFMLQLDRLLSPDGYFTEGAYYLRYAIWPFMLFAECIDHNRPQIGIFDYRDAILGKAMNALLQMNYGGVFMKFNDALTKQLDCQELIFAVDIAYRAYRNPMLLDVADRFQHKFLPCEAGYAVASDLASGKKSPLVFRSALYRDGADDTEGGIAVFRNDSDGDDSALTLKATSHGLSHGHYDKLTIAYYDNGGVILPDYGASRFLNIEAKYKGHYTRENKSFAMQTIAHNTVTVDRKSHFGGDIDISSKYHSDVCFFSATDGLSVVSATEDHATEGVKMQRTLFYDRAEWLEHPLIVDIFRLESDKIHSYDLPYYYGGHEVSLNFPYRKALTEMKALGKANGYQHLWVEAEGKNTESATTCFTFLQGDRFYSISTATTPQTELRMVRIGASDPNFNLRPDGGYIISCKAGNYTFASVIETHGTYDLQVEKTEKATSSVRSVTKTVDTKDYTVVRVEFEGGQARNYCFANRNTSATAKHRVKAGERILEWTGFCDVKNEN